MRDDLDIVSSTKGWGDPPGAMNNDNPAPVIDLALGLSSCMVPARPFGGLMPGEADMVRAALGAFRAALPEDRLAATHALTPVGCAVLLEFARDAAQGAVRERSPGLVNEGLLALALEGGMQDPRDTIIVLAVFLRSSEILGLDPGTLFSEAANLFAREALAAEVRHFPARPEDDRKLRAFRIAERHSKEGFSYEQMAWDFRPAVRGARIAELVRRLRQRLSW
jgi:hypothetical protein